MVSFPAYNFYTMFYNSQIQEQIKVTIKEYLQSRYPNKNVAFNIDAYKCSLCGSDYIVEVKVRLDNDTEKITFIFDPIIPTLIEAKSGIRIGIYKDKKFCPFCKDLLVSYIVDKALNKLDTIIEEKVASLKVFFKFKKIRTRYMLRVYSSNFNETYRSIDEIKETIKKLKREILLRVVQNEEENAIIIKDIDNKDVDDTIKEMINYQSKIIYELAALVKIANNNFKDLTIVPTDAKEKIILRFIEIADVDFNEAITSLKERGIIMSDDRTYALGTNKMLEDLKEKGIFKAFLMRKDEELYIAKYKNEGEEKIWYYSSEIIDKIKKHKDVFPFIEIFVSGPGVLIIRTKKNFYIYIAPRIM